MSLLHAKLLSAERDRHQAERTETRRSQVGTGDRSERIRTYNYAQRRVTDHRINHSVYQLSEFLNGDLDPMIQPLLQEQQTKLLSELEGSA